MLFFELLLQVPAQIDLRKGNEKSEISAFKDFATTFEFFVRGFLTVAALATFFYMVWGAFDWLTSGGESAKVESARKKITQAVVGLTVLMSIGAIFLALQYFLGIEVLSGGSGSSGGGVAVPTPCPPLVPC